MNYFLMNIAGTVLKGMTFNAFGAKPNGTGTGGTNNQQVIIDLVNDIKAAVDLVIWPLMILVGAAGSIYAVVLGVNMAKADSGEKREEAKKRLITAVVGLVIVVALILLMRLLFSDLVLGQILKPE